MLPTGAGKDLKSLERDGDLWVSQALISSTICSHVTLGCDVEEYPFGNSQASSQPTWLDRDFDNGKVWPVLRLIPHLENQNHGSFLSSWLGEVKAELKKQNGGVARKSFTYCEIFSSCNGVCQSS